MLKGPFLKERPLKTPKNFSCRKLLFSVFYFVEEQNGNKILTFACYDKGNDTVGGCAMFQILIVEDDKDLNKTVCSFLNHSGYQAVGCLSAAEAYDALYETVFDCIISDIMMPGVDGFEFARNVRELNSDIPILFMTARDDIASKQRGFRIGVDDYMVKPIDTGEMILRVSALLRRAKIVNERRLTVGNTVLQYDYLTVNDGEKEITLPQKEFNILYKLLSEPGHIFTRQHLMDEFWGMDSETDARTVDVHINRLREKFGNNSDFQIVTVRGLGYKAVKK